MGKTHGGTDGFFAGQEGEEYEQEYDMDQDIELINAVEGLQQALANRQNS